MSFTRVKWGLGHASVLPKAFPNSSGFAVLNGGRLGRGFALGDLPICGCTRIRESGTA